MYPLSIRCFTVPVLVASLVLAGCKTLPTQSADASGSGAQISDFATSCLKGAVLGAAADAAYRILTGGGKSASDALKGRSGELAKAAAAGCVISLAVTAIGKVMNERQQAKHEEAMQRDARRRSEEARLFASKEQRILAAPATTSAQQANRDAELAKARADYEAAMKRPNVVDLGENGSSIISVEAPKVATTNPAGSAAGQCTEYSVFTKTATGQAKQYETWCPNSQGAMVRTEARTA